MNAGEVDMDVDDRVALVTGGGRGIGRGIVIALAKNGADVAVADLNLAEAQIVAGEVVYMGRKSIPVRVDVTDQQSVDRMVEEAIASFGRIDILVNNAGVIAAPGWEERIRSNEEDWDATYEVNVKGAARVTDAVAPHMKERRRGKIVNISSVAGRQATTTSTAYSASKAAAISLSQSSALELAPFDINVNTICPGLLWTPIWERISYKWSLDKEISEGLSPREIFDRTVKQRTPLGREQTPEDIGNLATFLASDYAKNITGQAINVNGGSYMN